MSEQPYPKGVDAVWLASDRVGNIAAFISAGVGPIPIAALSLRSLAVVEIEQHICEMPALSATRLIVHVKRPDSFLELASRGIFVYDWSDVSRVTKDKKNLYELVASPSEPITTKELPSILSLLVDEIRFLSFEFSTLNEIDVHAYFECRESK
jgi:hypothetical protein